MEAAAASSGCSESGSPRFAAGPRLRRRLALPAQNLARRPLWTAENRKSAAAGFRVFGRDLLPWASAGETAREAAPVAGPARDPVENRAVRELAAGRDSEAVMDRLAAGRVDPPD